MVSTSALLLLALAAGTDAAPSTSSPFGTLSNIWKRYYGDEYHLARPGPLVEKRATLPSGWSYGGCVTESRNERLLQGFAFSTRANSPTLCLTECAKRGFTIAGTENGDECYCAAKFTGAGGATVGDSYCSMPCAADRSSKCGAAWYLSVYTYNATLGGLLCGEQPPKPPPIPAPTTSTTIPPTTTAAPTGWSSLGCGADNWSRLLDHKLDVPNLTPQKCQAACAAQGFMYAGVENGGECYCDNTLTPTVKWESANSNCKTPCRGDANLPCGGPWKLQIYRNGSPSTTTGTPPTTTTSTVPTKPSIPASSQPHYVWAHHMVGNTLPYTLANWADDIRRAKDQAIDGFALNMGRETWELDKIRLAYRAAEAAGGFKLFISLDMSSLRCGSGGDANNLVNIIKAVGGSPAQAKVNNKILVSTFAGENCNFGTGSNAAWKTLFKDPLAAAGFPVHFAPTFFGSPSSFSGMAWLDGEVNWNSAWPMGDHDITTGATDQAYLSALGSKSYITTVSPFFFTHFGPSTWNKNWIYRSDDWLYCSRWEEIIALRDKSFMTEILTWNDYGESSYIGPISGMLPATSGAWVDGFDHTGLDALTKYYATAYKTGAYPAITKDSIVMWSRPHAANANAISDNVGRPANAQWTNDNLYAVVLTTAPASVILRSGSTSQTFNVPAGLSKLKIPNAVGAIGGSIQRGGREVAHYSSGNSFDFNHNPLTYNFNYFVGASV